MPKINLANGKIFSTDGTETMLDAALRAGVVLEHSCKTGRCGACKTSLVSGASVLVGSEAGLTLAERESGWILSCVRVATSDVELGVEDIGDVTIFPVKTLPCRIVAIEHISVDVVRLTLRLPPAQRLDYHPGQYLDLIGKDALRRSYSVANAPRSDNLIELHIRQVPDGAMSRYLFGEAKANDLLRLNGPLGTFFLRDVAGLQLILLATGTGMAPVKAMLEAMAAWPVERLPRSITVFWGGRIAADLYWNPADSGVALQFVPVLSRADGAWTGQRGHVQQAVLAAFPSLQDAVVYACGSVNMIEGARAMLAAAGLPDHRFYSDAFVASAHEVTVDASSTN